MRIKGRCIRISQIVLVGIFITMALVARDIQNINISKYVFLVLVLIPICFAKIEALTIFMGFIIPLYVGLPGNLISVALLIRLIYAAFIGQIRLEKKGFILTLIISVYILFQNICTGYTEIYHLMAAMDFIVLYLLCSIVLQKNISREVIISYIMGVLVTGLVMLGATLDYYSIEELMNSATRLGYTGMLLKNTGNSMATSIDPNFYAMNVIAAVSTGTLVINQKIKAKILIVVAMIGSVICCLIGLSRTFVIIIIIWAVLWGVSQGKLKRTVIALGLLGLVIAAFIYFFPTVTTGILDRFAENDVVGGNGRINLILMYYEPWQESLGTILFGIGLFNCHTHCGPLLYLFGIGILGMIPLILWFENYYYKCKSQIYGFKVKYWVPLFVTFCCFSSIPAAGAINYTFPLIIAITALAIRARNGD